MSIRLKFNLAMFLVFAIGFAASAFLIERILLENAKDEVALKAKIMMEAARSMRSYTVEEIRPLLQKVKTDEFLAQTVPALATCVCDLPVAAACCASDAVEPAGPSGCCTSSDADAAQPMTITAPPCEKQAPDVDLQAASLPLEDATGRAALATATVDASLTTDSLRVEQRTAFQRGPPGTPSVPVYLLKASFLI